MSDVAGVSAVFTFSVPVSTERFSTVGAGEAVEGFTVDQVGMCFPPCPSTCLAAKPRLSAAQLAPAIQTAHYISYTRYRCDCARGRNVVASTPAFDRMGGRTVSWSFWETGMKVVYTDEQRRVAVAMFGKLRSYTQTCRVLGYSSLHTLRDWVGQSGRGRRAVKKRKPPRRYSWEFKLKAVERMDHGEAVGVIAQDLGIDVPPLLYRWVRQWKREGQWGADDEKRAEEGWWLCYSGSTRAVTAR